MIKVGDVVQLRSGGCLMTVSQVGQTIETRPIGCVWFDDDNQLRSESFTVKSLRRVIVDDSPLTIE